MSDEAVKVRGALERLADRYAYQTRHGTQYGADLVLDEMVLFVTQVQPTAALEARLASAERVVRASIRAAECYCNEPRAGG